MDELISVIVPVYNSESYLHKCITSLINQSYLNLEILLIDNGSTDNSLEICQNYAEKDERIKVYQAKDGSQGAARNLGILKSKGDYVMFADSGDYVVNDFCQNALTAIQKFNSDIVIFDYFIVKDGKLTLQNVFSKQVAGSVDKKIVVASLIDESFVWNKIFKRKLFSNIEFPSDEKYEDISTVYKLIAKAKKISYLNKTLYFYVTRSDSTVNTNTNVDTYLASSLKLYSFIQNDYPEIYKRDEIQESLVELVLFYISKGKRNDDFLEDKAMNIITNTHIIPKQLSNKSRILLLLLRYFPLLANFLLSAKRKVTEN